MDLRKVFDQTVRDLKREVNKKVLKVPEIEQKVLDATSNEPWGPHGTVMSEIAQATRNFNDYQMIMALLWKRLSDTGKNWRHVYKGLTVFDFLVAHGADRVIDELREHVFQIQGLLDFQYVEPNGKDQGINVRKKAQALVSLLNDKDKIREVREKAASNRDKYQGYSSTGGFKPSSYSSAGRGFSDWNDDRNGYGDKYGSKYDDDRYAKGGERENDRYRDDYDYDKQSKGFESDDNDYSTRTKTAPPSYEESRKKDVKPKSQSLNIPTVNEDDDFDPRAPVRTTVKPATVAQADFLGDIDFFSTPSNADPFSDSTSNTKKSEPVTSSTDLFAAAPTLDPFGSNDFGAFASASSTNTFDAFDSKPSSKNNAASNTLFDPFADTLHASNNAFESDPNSSNVFDNNITTSFNAFDDQALDNKGTSFDAFGDVLSGNTSNIPAAASDMPGAQSKQSFQTKSSVWADSLTSGLIDLNISAPKSNSLADLGIQLDSGFGSEWPKEEKSQGGLKGKAMGTGSGLGLAGASGLAPRPPPPTMASDFGLGAYTGAYSQASTASYSQPSVAYFQASSANAGLFTTPAAPAQPDPFASLASFR